jgi:hypothetical protein
LKVSYLGNGKRSCVDISGFAGGCDKTMASGITFDEALVRHPPTFRVNGVMPFVAERHSIYLDVAQNSRSIVTEQNVCLDEQGQQTLSKGRDNDLLRVYSHG